MFNLKFRKSFFPIVWLLSGGVFAQEVKIIEDWRDFGQIPKSWKQVGGVLADWESNDFVSTSPGTGILVNPPKPKNGPHLVSGFEHGDIELELEYMIPKGSNSGVYLQGRYEVQIFDSWGKANPNSGDAGGIYQRWNSETRQGFEGKAPRMNVSKAPGLWQHLKIVFEAPRFNPEGVKVKNAKFVQVFLNGVLIHENIEVTGPTTSAMFEDEKELGPIMIQGDHGPIAIRKIGYKLFGNPTPQIKDLKYAYYKGKFQSVEEFKGIEPNEKGQLNKITWDLGHGVLDFAYEYSGNLEVPVSGDYTFSLATFGSSSLYVNGQNVLEDQNESPRSRTMRLEKGSTSFKLIFYKPNYPGRRPQLGFFIEGPGIKRSPLHDPNSYVEHVIQKPLYVEVMDEPLVLRGFLKHGDQVRTHTVSVGESSGANFVYDLQLGAPLGIWRGGFLDTSPMWRQRGESQLMLPNGAFVELVAGPTIAELDSRNSVWPDSLNSDLLRIQGYFLNRDRRPTFRYTFDQVAVEDFFETELDGKVLARTISYRNAKLSSNFWARIIAAESIADLGGGVYLINQGEYYVKFPDGVPSNAVLRNSPLGQELLIPLSKQDEKSTIKYSLIY
jgi:hypothetical protein